MRHCLSARRRAGQIATLEYVDWFNHRRLETCGLLSTLGVVMR